MFFNILCLFICFYLFIFKYLYVLFLIVLFNLKTKLITNLGINLVNN
jgi:hypothetical protein